MHISLSFIASVSVCEVCTDLHGKTEAEGICQEFILGGASSCTWPLFRAPAPFSLQRGTGHTGPGPGR